MEIKAEINEMKNKKIIPKIHETESWFFERSTKFDRLSARLTRTQKKENTNY